MVVGCIYFRFDADPSGSGLDPRPGFGLDVSNVPNGRVQLPQEGEMAHGMGGDVVVVHCPRRREKWIPGADH